MNTMKSTLLCALVLMLTACGGGGGSASTPVASQPTPPVVQSYSGPAGYYTYENASTGMSGRLLLAPDGSFYSETSIPQCMMLQTGSIKVASDNYTVSGSEVSLVNKLAQSQACGGNTSLTIDGSIIIGDELDFYPSDGTDIEWKYDSSVSQDVTSLARISGQYKVTDGTVINIHTDGTLDAQDATTGCVINGTVAIPNSGVNVYAVSFTFDNCTGDSSVLNGKTASGFYAVDYNDNTLFGGASMQLNGNTIVVESEAQKI